MVLASYSRSQIYKSNYKGQTIRRNQFDTFYWINRDNILIDHQQFSSCHCSKFEFHMKISLLRMKYFVAVLYWYVSFTFSFLLRFILVIYSRFRRYSVSIFWTITCFSIWSRNIKFRYIEIVFIKNTLFLKRIFVLSIVLYTNYSLKYTFTE